MITPARSNACVGVLIRIAVLIVRDSFHRRDADVDTEINLLVHCLIC